MRNITKITIIALAIVLALIFSALPFTVDVRAQPTGVQTHILRPNGDNYLQWDVSGSQYTIYSTNYGYYDGGTAGEAYISVSLTAHYNRYILMSFDLSSIPDGATISDIAVYAGLNYSTMSNNQPMAVHATKAIGMLGYKSMFTALGTAEDGNDAHFMNWFYPNNEAMNISMSNTLGYMTNHGMKSTWQTQFNTNKTVYVGFSTLNAIGTEKSWGISIHGGTYPSYIIVTIAGAGSHYNKLTSTPTGGDGDATYVTTTTTALIDRYTMTDLSLGSSGAVKSITSVQTWAIARRTSVAGVTFIQGMYQGGVYTPTGTAAGVTDSYVNYTSTVMTVNPYTTSAWTLSDVQNFVFYITSTWAGTKDCRVTQVGLVVIVNYGWQTTFTSSPPAGSHSGNWWPGDAYSYTITTNSTSTKTNLVKASWQTWTGANDTLWGRVPIATASQTDSVSTKALSASGYQDQWQNYTFNIVNTPPTITSSPVTTVHWSSNYYYNLTGTEYETSITWAFTTNWTGLSDTGAGHLYKAQPHAVGWHWIKVTAFDGLYYAYQNYSVTITNSAPSFASSPITTIHWSVTYSYHVIAQVFDGDTMTYGLVTNWSGASINQVTTTAYVNRTQPHVVGWYYVDVSVTDGLVTIWQNYTVTVTDTTPYFISSPVLTVHWRTSYYYDVNAIDPDDTIYYDVATNWTGLTIDSGTGVLSKTQPHALAWYYVYVSITDGLRTAWQNFTVNITDAATPAFTSSPVTTVHWKTDYYYDSTAIDTDGDTVTYTLATDFPGANCGLYTGIVTNTQPFALTAYYINITASDTIKSSYQNFTLVITNFAPVFTSSPLTQVYYYQAYNYQATTTQGDSDPLTYGGSSNYSGLTISLTGLVHKSLPETIAIYDVNLSVTDGIVTVWQNYSLSVLYFVGWAPIFTTVPPSITLSGASYSYTPLFNESVTGFTVITNASWLHVSGHTIFGIVPTTNVTLWFNISIEATSVAGLNSTFQNYTLYVQPTTVSIGGVAPAGTLVLTVIIGFFLIFWGFQKGEYHWLLFAGFVWIFSAITVLLTYGPGWMVVGLGIGLMIIAKGTFSLGRRGDE